MIVKIVGFKVGRDKSTCYYKVDLTRHMQEYQDEGVGLRDIQESLGHYLWLALEKSDFVSVRK